MVMLMVVTVSMRVLGIAVRGGSVGDIGSSDGGDTVYARPRESSEGGDGKEKEADYFDRVVSKIGTKMPNAHCHVMYIFIHVLVDSCNFISISSDRTHE